MILGFKKQFVDSIIKGSKIHTIREDKSNRWKTGNVIHFATGTRTPRYKEFGRGECISTQEIKIIWTEISSILTGFQVLVDGRNLKAKEIQKLASNDGFNNLFEFQDWFNKDFSGKIIHWTNFKY